MQQQQLLILLRHENKRTSSANAYSVTVTDASIDAGDLNAIDAKTAGLVTANATAITGSLSDVKALYEANVAGTVSALGNEAVTISDAGSVKAADINFVNSNTSGAFTANKVTTITGTVDEIKATYAAYASGTITGLGDEAITISDIGTTSADLAAVKALTTGTVTLSLNSTSVTATSLNSLDANSTETIGAGAVTTITGAAADVNGLCGIWNNWIRDEAVTLTDTSTAAVLKTLDGNTTGSVNAGTVTSLTGSAADLTTAYASSGITGLGNEAVTLTDTTVAASTLNTLDGNTTGTIDASSLTKLTGTSADAKTAFDSAGINLTFDASSYLAGYSDLLAAFGTDLTAAKAHYFAHGVSEGRSFDAFDESSYLAGYSIF